MFCIRIYIYLIILVLLDTFENIVPNGLLIYLCVYTVQLLISSLPVFAVINNPATNIFGQKKIKGKKKQQFCILDDFLGISS